VDLIALGHCIGRSFKCRLRVDCRGSVVYAIVEVGSLALRGFESVPPVILNASHSSLSEMLAVIGSTAGPIRDVVHFYGSDSSLQAAPLPRQIAAWRRSACPAECIRSSVKCRAVYDTIDNNYVVHVRSS